MSGQMNGRPYAQEVVCVWVVFQQVSRSRTRGMGAWIELGLKRRLADVAAIPQSILASHEGGC